MRRVEGSRLILKNAAFRDAAWDDSVAVVVLTGAGEKAFCAGGDLKAMRFWASEGQGFGRSDFRKLLLEIVQYPKPTVALVRGHVMGGGLGIVLACDLGLACEDVSFSTPEIQVGMFPMMVMGLLYRNVGRKRATEMMFLGERITAAQAEEFGIINHAYPRDQFEAAAALSAKVHVVRVEKPFRLVVSVMPTMYEDLWTAAKGMYKVEPVVEDGGEVVIYAPQLGADPRYHQCARRSSLRQRFRHAVPGRPAQRAYGKGPRSR